MRHVPGPSVTNGANDTQSDASHGEKHSNDGLCRVEEGSVGVDVRGRCGGGIQMEKSCSGGVSIAV